MIEPWRAWGLPQIVIISVDLPAPLAPIMATISPGLHVKVDAFQGLDIAVEGLDATDFEKGISTQTLFTPLGLVPALPGIARQFLGLTNPILTGDAAVKFKITFSLDDISFLPASDVSKSAHAVADSACAR